MNEEKKSPKEKKEEVVYHVSPNVEVVQKPKKSNEKIVYHVSK